MIYFVMIIIFSVGEAHFMQTNGAFNTKAECTHELRKVLKKGDAESGYCESRYGK